MTVTERMAAWRWEWRVLRWVSRAAWRLDQAERERAWALASARAEGISIHKLAAAAGFSPARVHQDPLDARMAEHAPGRGHQVLAAAHLAGLARGQGLAEVPHRVQEAPGVMDDTRRRLCMYLERRPG